GRGALHERTGQRVPAPLVGGGAGGTRGGRRGGRGVEPQELDAHLHAAAHGGQRAVEGGPLARQPAVDVGGTQRGAVPERHEPVGVERGGDDLVVQGERGGAGGWNDGRGAGQDHEIGDGAPLDAR